MVSDDLDFPWLISDEHDVEAYQAGAAVFREGEQGELMYVVRSGEIDISVQGVAVESVGRGRVFGEMALIDGAPRSATATARTDAEVLPVDRRKFVFLVHQTPFFALDVMRTLADRLRAMNERLAG